MMAAREAAENIVRGQQARGGDRSLLVAICFVPSLAWLAFFCSLVVAALLSSIIICGSPPSPQTAAASS
jgi:hypothetical protein